MCTDELNRKMEFVVKQQAQGTSDIQRLTERQEGFQEQHERCQQEHERERARFREYLERLSAALASTRQTASDCLDYFRHH